MTGLSKKLTSHSVLEVTGKDRILLFAPHPDDEVLAGGGVLQQAAVQGATVKVIFFTNGDDNPWPHRIATRRWRLGEKDQEAWGRLRRRESVRSMRQLGFGADVIDFINWKDQSLTDLLMQQAHRAVRQIFSLIEKYKPTRLFYPSLGDGHPDHNALAIMTRLALASVYESPEEFHYVVHKTGRPDLGLPVSYRLGEAEMRTKKRAIQCHATQMLLSRKRFLAYATDVEDFFIPSEFNKVKQRMEFSDGKLRVDVGHLGDTGDFLFVVEGEEGELETGIVSHTGTRREQGEKVIDINISAGIVPVRLFLKPLRTTGFYDAEGWMETNILAAKTKLPLDAVAGVMEFAK